MNPDFRCGITDDDGSVLSKPDRHSRIQPETNERAPQVVRSARTWVKLELELKSSKPDQAAERSKQR